MRMIHAAVIGAACFVTVLTLRASADLVPCGEVGNTKDLDKGDSAQVLFYEGTASQAEWAAMVALTGDTCEECEGKGCVPFPGWTPLSGIQHYHEAAPTPPGQPQQYHGHAVAAKKSKIWLSCSKCE